MHVLATMVRDDAKDAFSHSASLPDAGAGRPDAFWGQARSLRQARFRVRASFSNRLRR